MERETPTYYAIIPADVRYDKDLRPNEKLLYGEITALSDKHGYCWATNRYFAELYEVTVKCVSKWINHLIEKGYLFSKILYEEDGKTVSQRIICVRPIREEDNPPIHQKEDTPLHQKEDTLSIKSSNIIIQDIITQEVNEKENKKRKSESELESDFEELWKIYPRKVGKKDAFKHYKAAIKNGTTNEQIRQGIENYNAWLKAKNETEFIKHGSTFFSKEAWNDDYDLTHVNRGDPFDVRNQYWDENDPTVH
jgi:hypothetical protein